MSDLTVDRLKWTSVFGPTSKVHSSGREQSELNEDNLVSRGEFRFHIPDVSLRGIQVDIGCFGGPKVVTLYPAERDVTAMVCIPGEYAVQRTNQAMTNHS